MKPLKLAVLFGGRSTEHEGSVESALHLLSYISSEKFKIHAVFVRPDGSFAPGREFLSRLSQWLNHPDISPFPHTRTPPPDFFERMRAFASGVHAGLKEEDDFLSCAAEKFYDAVFPVFHGLNGEDGTIQGLLEFLGLPFVGPGVLGSALCADKETAKRVCTASGLSTAPWVSFKKFRFLENPEKCMQETEESFSYPVFIKPVSLGSSIGVSRAENRQELEAGLKKAFCFDEKVLVEKGVNGHEYAVGVMGNQRLKVSVPAQFMSANPKIFDYDAKFGPGGLDDLIPAPLSPKMKAQLQDFSLKIYQALELSGMARIDSFIQGEEIFFNEVNTIPGLGGHSVFHRLWEAQGISKEQLVEELVFYAIERKKSRDALQYRFLAEN